MEKWGCEGVVMERAWRRCGRSWRCMADTCKPVAVTYWRRVANEGLVNATAAVREEA